MGDPRGFLKVRTRRELAERPVEERIKDWFDVHTESACSPGPPSRRPAAWIAEPRSA